MPDLTVSLVQTELHWEDRARNLDMLGGLLRTMPASTHLIVLPEMFTTGFSMNAAELAEPVNGPAIDWMRRMAADRACILTGSLIVSEGGRFFNRLIWMNPDGSFLQYDKRHLFRLGEEHLTFAAGSSRLVAEIQGWRICPLICYDLRFPVWSRNRGDYDALLYVANWPRARRRAWTSLLRARAIENQAYVIAVNRIGEDGMGIRYSGDSGVYDPRGRKLSRLKAGEDRIETLTISRAALEEYRAAFPFALDADDFEMR
jgi:predicted amidohydrolase